MFSLDIKRNAFGFLCFLLDKAKRHIDTIRRLFAFDLQNPLKFPFHSISCHKENTNLLQIDVPNTI